MQHPETQKCKPLFQYSNNGVAVSFLILPSPCLHIQNGLWLQQKNSQLYFLIWIAETQRQSVYYYYYYYYWRWRRPANFSGCRRRKNWISRCLGGQVFTEFIAVVWTSLHRIKGWLWLRGGTSVLLLEGHWFDSPALHVKVSGRFWGCWNYVK